MEVIALGVRVAEERVTTSDKSTRTFAIAELEAGPEQGNGLRRWRRSRLRHSKLPNVPSSRTMTKLPRKRPSRTMTKLPRKRTMTKRAAVLNAWPRPQWVASGSRLGVGGYFAVVAQDKFSDSNPECNGSNVCTRGGKSLRDDARTSATVATVATGIGIGALAGAAVLWFTSGSTDYSSLTAWEVQPSFDGHSVSVRGGF